MKAEALFNDIAPLSIAYIAKGTGQKAEGSRAEGRRQKGCLLTGLGFSIWRESRVALATAIPTNRR